MATWFSLKLVNIGQSRQLFQLWFTKNHLLQHQPKLSNAERRFHLFFSNFATKARIFHRNSFIMLRLTKTYNFEFPGQRLFQILRNLPSLYFLCTCNIRVKIVLRLLNLSLKRAEENSLSFLIIPVVSGWAAQVVLSQLEVSIWQIHNQRYKKWTIWDKKNIYSNDFGIFRYFLNNYC